MTNITNNGFDNDLAFEDFLKRFKGFYREENPHVNLNLFKKTYFRNIKTPSVYQQQVVIKIPNKGRGIRHLNLLLKYISRDLPQHENVESEKLYGSDGEIIPLSEIENITAQWSKDFPSNDSNLSEEAQNVIEEVQRHETILALKKEDVGVTKEENELAFQIKKFKDRSKLKNQNDILDGDFVKDKDGQYGFITRDQHGGFSLTYFNDAGEINKKDITADGLINQRALYHKSRKNLRNDFTHMILSTGGDNPNAKDSFSATKDFLEERLGSRGYEYYFAEHKDTKHLHYHVIVRHKSRQKEQGVFSVDKFDLLDMRERYAEHLDLYGIDRQATYKFDRADYLKSLDDKVQRVKDSKDWYNYKIEESQNKYFAAASYRKRVLNEMDFLGEKLKDLGLNKEVRTIKQMREEYEIGSKEEATKIIEYTHEFLKKDFEQLGKKYFEVVADRVDPAFLSDPHNHSTSLVGSIVKAHDRGNIGTVIAQDADKDLFSIEFVNPETEQSFTKDFKAEDISLVHLHEEQKPDQAMVMRVKELDTEGRKSFDRNIKKYDTYLDSQIEEIQKIPKKLLDDELAMRQKAILQYLEHKRTLLNEYKQEVGNPKGMQQEKDKGTELELKPSKQKDS